MTVFFFSSPNVINGATGIWAQRLSVFLIPPILLLLKVAMERRIGAIAGRSGVRHRPSGDAAVRAGRLHRAFRLAVARVRACRRARGRGRREAGDAGVLADSVGRHARGSRNRGRRCRLGLGDRAFGGIDLHLFGLRIRSNAWRRPAWLALIAALAWLWMNRRMIRARAPRPSAWLVGFAVGALAGTTANWPGCMSAHSWSTAPSPRTSC